MSGLHLPYATFDQKLQIRRARLVMIKTKLIRVLQSQNLKSLGTPSVVAIQKRTMVIGTRHKTHGSPPHTSTRPGSRVDDLFFVRNEFVVQSEV